MILHLCSTGRPKPTLARHHNGCEINAAASKEFRIVTKDSIYTLIIDSVSQANDGDYMVTASNAAGSAHTTANLCVQGRAATTSLSPRGAKQPDECLAGEAVEFSRRLEDMEVKEGSNVDLSVQLSTETGAAVRWHKDGQALDRADDRFTFLSDGTRHTLRIATATATVHHEGEYVAAVGEQECACELTVVGNDHLIPTAGPSDAPLRRKPPPQLHFRVAAQVHQEDVRCQGDGGRDGLLRDRAVQGRRGHQVVQGRHGAR